MREYKPSMKTYGKSKTPSDRLAMWWTANPFKKVRFLSRCPMKSYMRGIIYPLYDA